MRICFIALGNFVHAVPYFQYFKDAGHDVHFVAMSPGPDYGVRTYNVGFGTGYSPRSGKWKYPFSMLLARRLVRKIKPDIVHAHYATSCGLTALVCGYHPFIVTAHGSDVTSSMRSKIWRPLLTRIFSSADGVNTVSDELADMVAELGINREKIVTLTLGIDTQQFYFVNRPSISQDRPLRLVCTRRLEDVYDHTTIIEALALLEQQDIDFRMTFIGDGLMRPYLQELVKEKNLSAKVVFTGAVENSSLPEVLKEYDIYLSASLRDGTSLCLLEAMANGLYPIVSRINANTAWLKHGENGLLHEVSNPHDLAECISKAVEHPDSVTDAVQKNRVLIEEKGNRVKNMKSLEGLYEQIRMKYEKQ
jgi:glycosyltransferase involved in cell wall biosynthesis